MSLALITRETQDIPKYQNIPLKAVHKSVKLLKTLLYLVRLYFSAGPDVRAKSVLATSAGGWRGGWRHVTRVQLLSSGRSLSRVSPQLCRVQAALPRPCPAPSPAPVSCFVFISHCGGAETSGLVLPNFNIDLRFYNDT